MVNSEVGDGDGGNDLNGRCCTTEGSVERRRESEVEIGGSVIGRS